MATITVSGGGSALADAVATASDGDEILCGAGVYSPVVNKSSSVSVTIRALDGACVIDGGVSIPDRTTVPSATTGSGAFAFAKRSNVYGFEIRNVMPDGTSVYDGPIVYQANLYNCRIHDCAFYNTSQVGASQNCGFVNSYFHRCELQRIRDFRQAGTTYDTFITCSLTRCVLSEVDGKRRWLSYNTNFKSCLIKDGIYASDMCQSTTLVNCTLIGNKIGSNHAVIANGYSARTNYVVANLIFGSSGGTADINGMGPSYYTKYVFWNNVCERSVNILSGTDAGGNVSNATSEQISFVDPTNNFRLNPESICVGAGGDAYSSQRYAVDLDGKPWKDPPAVGAYEFCSKQKNMPNALFCPLGGGMTLPYDSKVEWLESTGTQFIDSGVDAAMDVKMSIDAISLNSGSSQFHAMGVYIDSSSADSYALFCSSVGMIQASVGNCTNRVSADGVDWNTRRTVELDCGELIVDDVSYGFPPTVPTSLETPRRIYVCGLNGVALHSGKWYGAKIYKNNVLLRDFIPVRAGQTGYLYDKVSGKFFANQGAGSFILGPDID